MGLLTKNPAACVPLEENRLKLFNNLFPGGKSFQYQRDWADDKSQYKLGVKARQIGITFTEAVDNFIECLLWKESDKYSTPHVIVFASPSQRQSNRLMQYLMKIRSTFEKVYNTRLIFKKEREDLLTFENFCEIWSLPNNPKTMEGIDSNKAIIDEAGNFSGYEDQQVYEALMGSLGAKGGKMVLFGRPRGRRGLFWKLRDPYGEFVGQYNIHEFPWTVRAEEDPRYKKTVESQMQRMSKISFAEQYLCEFSDENVVVFPYDLLTRQSRVFKMWTLDESHKSPNPVYMGIDFAKRADQTVVSIVDHGEKETILKFQETSRKSYDQQISWITELVRHFNPLKVLIDETALGIPLLDMLKAKFGDKIEGVHFSSATKEKLLMTMKNLFEEGRLIIPDDPVIIDQLHGMEKEVSEKGTIRYTGKRVETDWLDDRVWSLALSVSQLGEGDWSMTMISPVGLKPLSPRERFARGLDEEGNEL